MCCSSTGARTPPSISGTSYGKVTPIQDGLATEIKLGGKPLIEKGAEALDKLALKIDTSRMKPPAFKMVLTAVGDYAYTRKDGIIVCPIGALKP